MDQNYWDNPNGWKNTTTLPGTYAGTMTQFFTQTYTWMALGLALTGAVAVLTIATPALLSFIFGNPFVFYGLLIAEIGLVIAFSASLSRGASVPALIAMFLTYSALNGLTFSSIFLVYTGASIARVFFISAGTFAGMSLYGAVTKRDLTGVGHFARMGVLAIFIAMIVNIFLKSSALDYAVSLIGVGVFVVLTAVDTQRLKAMFAQLSHDEASVKRLALQGALQLYLDFINMFLFLLRLMGNRR